MTPRSIRIRPALVATILVAGVASAQRGTAVFPSDHDPLPASTGAGSNHALTQGVNRQQWLYEGWDLQISAGRSITRLGFRSPQGQYFGKQVLLEVAMGPTTTDVAGMAGTFAANHQAPLTVVFARKVFVMPDMGNPLNPNPDNDMLWIPLDQPYAVDPSQNLVVEYRVFANSNGNAAFTYPMLWPRTLSPTATGVPGCPSSSGVVPVMSTSGRVGSSWSASLDRAPLNSFAILAIDIGNGFLANPTPLASLVPGADPSCEVGVPLNLSLLVLQASTGASGRADWSAPIPNDRVLWGRVDISVQAYCLDFFAPGGGILSNAASVNLGIAPAMRGIGSGGDPTVVTSGSNVGTLITYFDYQ